MLLEAMGYLPWLVAEVNDVIHLVNTFMFMSLGVNVYLSNLMVAL
jgi:hypothetical protein